MNKLLSYSCSLIFLGSSLSIAEEVTLSEVVVTATRSARTVDDSMASVTVITRKDIENSQALNISDILRNVPGIDITNSGGFGKTSSIFMRGTNTNHVLVLVNGIKIGSATIGSVDFERLPISQIERIEVVRGPRSSLYGSEAIGGVIQIFTRKSSKNHIEATVGIGKHNTKQVTAGISSANKTSWFNLYADKFKTDGFNACKGSETAGCFTIEPDDDGYDSMAFSTNMGYRLGDKGSIELHGLQSKGHTEYDTSFINEADLKHQVFGVKTDYAVNNNWLINLNVGQSIDKYDEATTSFFHTTRTSSSLQTNFFIANHILSLGYDFQKDKVDSNVNYVTDSLDNQGLFFEYQGQFGKTQFIAGLRQDDNEQFDQHTTGNIGLGYALSQQTRLLLSYGTAFKAPSFNELYFPNFGNATLVPEESNSIEVSLAGTQSYYRWSLDLYHTKIDKLIATNFEPETGNYYADNINQAKITGIDGSVNWKKNNWDFNTKLSWVKPEDATTGNILPRRAEKSISISIAEKLGTIRSEINFLAQSSRYDDVNNTTRLGGYGIFNITSTNQINKNLSLRLRVENIFDKQYETSYLYNSFGRFWFLSLHYQN
ncbi:MAG: TonB-dependent receptor [Thiomargarita sp.]|nr:TonB-dependent receptor [Thiomargarita sp.]